MKNIFLLLAITAFITTKAQITKVSLQASGLTCSMCSNSINKALKTLDFVERIDADIKTYTFEISFKENCNVDFDKIKRKVEGAGFFVSGFVATIHFNNVALQENKPITIGDNTLLFSDTKQLVLNGTRRVKVLNKGFVSAGEFKKRKLIALSSGAYHVSL